MRFLHLADVHLGYQQYNLKDRYNDFGRAFGRAVDLALAREVDAVVIAGDLFHKASVEPLTLRQAEDGLKRLQEAGVPVLGVHGNHDRVRYLAQYSWLEYLADEQGLLTLLTPSFEDEHLPRLEPDVGYVDLDGVRFVGVPWLGATAPRVLNQVAEVLTALPQADIRFTVLITHAGVEGQMPHMPGGLTFAELAPLRGCVNYLALGHLHKPYMVDDWIYNPGSLETCSFDETAYERGAYLVEVDAAGAHTAEHIATVMRPFYTIHVDTGLFADPQALNDGVLTEIRQQARRIRKIVAGHPEPKQAAPVVRLVLRGYVTFDRSLLNLEAFRQMLLDEIDGALHVRVENRTTALGVDTVVMAEDLSREALERQVLSDIARSDTRYSAHSDVWSQVMQQIKGLALEGADPAVVYHILDDRMAELEGAEDVDH